MRRLLLAAALLLPAAPLGAAGLDLSPGAVARGERVYREVCHACHGMKYLGIAPLMPPDAARAAFGKFPPDLSLITQARGRGAGGARYVDLLLASYVAAPVKNSFLPGTAMPAPFDPADPLRERKAADVAAFLYRAADPHGAEREALGAPVLVYSAVLTLLLFLVNRRTWKRLPPPPSRPARG